MRWACGWRVRLDGGPGDGCGLSAGGGCYAIGYQWAAISTTRGSGPITTVNVWTAFVVLAVLLALFTPIADPARIGVSQPDGAFGQRPRDRG
jgi:hypothetical protein